MELLNYEKLVKLLSIKGCEGRELNPHGITPLDPKFLKLLNSGGPFNTQIFENHCISSNLQILNFLLRSPPE